MRVIRSLSALAFLGVFPLGAQITTTLSHLPDGSDEVKIRNGSTMNLAAFVASVKPEPGPFAGNAPLVKYSDPLVDSTAKPLAAGEERVPWRVHFGEMPPASALRSMAHPVGKTEQHLEERVATAGVFADGSTFGDAGLLTRLMLRRSNMLLAVETTLETLSDAGMHNVPRRQLIEQFKKMASSMSRWYVLPEQQVGDGLYQSMVGKLMGLPDGPAGSAFPPAGFVAQETAALRQQRIALLGSEPSLSFANLAGK